MKMPGYVILPIILAAATVCAADGLLLIDDFENGLRSEWKERSFAGNTDYRVVTDGDDHVLEAVSRGTASSLYFEKELDLGDYPVLGWCWKIEGTIPGGDAGTRETDDYAARVYVVFPHWLFTRIRTINYIWANRLEPGEIVPNPFTANAQMVAVRSGNELAGEWVCETRNVAEDYRRAFGEEPRRVGGIAIMTDTDNTGTSARAWYDDIRFGKAAERLD